MPNDLRKPIGRRGIRCDNVKLWIPPEGIALVASSRTAGIMHCFMVRGARAADVALFAESCYMQGLRDMADAAVMQGWEPKGTTDAE